MSLFGVELLVALSIYFFLSALLWLWPFIHTKKQPKFLAQHISHRGGSAEGYENTLKTFAHAVSCSTDMLEMDVRLTKDGKVVVTHDENLFRLTGLSQLVSETDYQDIPSIQPTVPIEHLPDEPYKDASWALEERQIPLLIEVFSQFPQTPINIDIKTHNEELIRKVSDLIHAFKRVDITVWGSSEKRTSDLCYSIDPEIPRFFCTFKVIFTLVLAVTGLLPFMNIRETHFEVFLPLIIKRLIQKRKRLSRVEEFLFWLPNIFMYAQPFNFVSHLKARGIQVYFWVCNKNDEFEECLKIGSSGIMTDYPTNLRNFLNSNAANLAKTS